MDGETISSSAMMVLYRHLRASFRYASFLTPRNDTESEFMRR